MSDLNVQQGDDFLKVWTLNRRAPRDARVFGHVRQSPEGPLLYELPVRVEGEKVILDIPGEESSKWTFRRANYDIKILWGGGRSTRVDRGAILVDLEYTHV